MRLQSDSDLEDFNQPIDSSEFPDFVVPEVDKEELNAIYEESKWRPGEGQEDPISYQPAIEILPADVVAFKSAAAKGDVELAQQILRQWEEKPVSERCKWQEFTDGYEDAIDGSYSFVVSFMIEQGFEMKPRYFKQAVEKRRFAILELLLQHGYDINGPDPIQFSHNPPLLAITYHDEELMHWFLNHGADPNFVSKRGVTPLSIAARDAPLGIIKLLIQRGGIRWLDRGEILYFAAARDKSDRIEVMEYLLDQGAQSKIDDLLFANRPDLADQENWVIGCKNVLQSAADEGDLNMVKFLVARGANSSLPDGKGRRAVDLAKERGHADVVEFLEGPPPRALL